MAKRRAPRDRRADADAGAENFRVERPFSTQPAPAKLKQPEPNELERLRGQVKEAAAYRRQMEGIEQRLQDQLARQREAHEAELAELSVAHSHALIALRGELEPQRNHVEEMTRLTAALTTRAAERARAVTERDDQLAERVRELAGDQIAARDLQIAEQARRLAARDKQLAELFRELNGSGDATRGPRDQQQLAEQHARELAERDERIAQMTEQLRAQAEEIQDAHYQMIALQQQVAELTGTREESAPSPRPRSDTVREATDSDIGVRKPSSRKT